MQFPERRRLKPVHQNRFAEQLEERIAGQSPAIARIAPWLEVQNAGLAPEGRPAGVFLLLGPTGTGKTRTVEAIAEILHGNPKKLIKVDCGEFALEHEVARLIGAPPGYLGHRETPPYFTRDALRANTTPGCDITVLLFDEIEKAAPSVTRLLLGILDKGMLRLGDNTTVNFEKTLIFFTSNLGAKRISRELNAGFGFSGLVGAGDSGRLRRIERIGMDAVRRRFTPEFINRIDSIVTYAPLGRDSLQRILGFLIEDLQAHIVKRLGSEAFALSIGPRARSFLLDEGASEEYGARELKRLLQRTIVQPLASLVAGGGIRPGATVEVHVSAGRLTLDWRRRAA